METMSLQLKVDVETTYEFIKEIYTHISPDFLQGLSKLLEEKSEQFTTILQKDNLDIAPQEDLSAIYKRIFALRRGLKKWGPDQFEQMREYTIQLLYDKLSLEKRFNAFCSRVKTNLKVTRPYEVASELLTYTDPLNYCLWTNWIYNPDTKNGSLVLVFSEDFKLEAQSHGELYPLIIEAQEKLLNMATDIGISASPDPLGNSVFDVPVFLCAVYAVYTFTVTKLRMTSEFNTILPNLDELLTRILGVYYSPPEKINKLKGVT